MKVYFVGAGPGNPELLTIKARRLIENARVCVYAGSLINPTVIALLPADTERYDSAVMNLEQIVAVFESARDRQIDVVRLHSGDPSLFSAIGEQIEALARRNIAYEVVPGVSSFQAAAATLGVELTSPEIAQTVILTRARGRTPMPESEDLRRLATSRATLCLFLSIDRAAEVAETLADYLGPDCPAAVVYHASWPDEKVIRGSLADIGQRIRAEGISRTALFLVGRALAGPGSRSSRLYDKTFSHGYRPGAPT
jgi:precorrin-4/cobalt-precorrin-4 C11-methyltransferase